MQSDEEITHLKTQVEIYRKDFEMERADREKTAGEKAQYAIDLLAMQRRNQELIEALAASQKNNKSSIASSAASTGSTRSSLRDEQRPVRVCNIIGYTQLKRILSFFILPGFGSNWSSCPDSRISLSNLFKSVRRADSSAKSC